LIFQFSKMRATDRTPENNILRHHSRFRHNIVLRIIYKALLSAIVPMLFLLFWHSRAIGIDNPLRLPPISNILDIMLNPMENVIGIGSIWRNTYISLIRVLLGYTVAALVAVPLGIIIGYSRVAKRMLLPFLSFFRSIPPIAWVPLVLAWFGITSAATILGVAITHPSFLILNNLRISMLAIIFLGAFFPILNNTIFGIESVRKSYVDAVRSMGAGPVALITKVYIPHAMPTIFTGLQVGLGTAWQTLVGAEMLPGSIAGLGFMITHAYQVMRIDVVISGMVSISIVGAILYAASHVIGNLCFKWKTQGK